jgi:hypothetical protein
MKIIDCEQGTDEWFQARLGIPSASMFNKIITPAKLQVSKQADDYVNKLCAEWVRNQGEDSYQSFDMKRGIDVEEEARDFYQFHTDYEVAQVGFCVADSGAYGCSPDGLIIDEGGVEIKCPTAGVHFGYLIDDMVPAIYRLQVLGSLLVTDYAWWDFVSYHPDMKPLIVRTQRAAVLGDLALLETALVGINKQIYDKKQIAIEKGIKQ